MDQRNFWKWKQPLKENHPRVMEAGVQQELYLVGKEFLRNLGYGIIAIRLPKLTHFKSVNRSSRIHELTAFFRKTLYPHALLGSTLAKRFYKF